MSANCQVRELNTSFRRGTITRILPGKGMVTRFASAPRACTNTSLSCWPWNNPLRESWNHRTTEINTRPFDIMNSRHQPWPGSASGQQWLFVSVSRSYIDQYHAKFHQCVCNSQAFWYEMRFNGEVSWSGGEMAKGSAMQSVTGCSSSPAKPRGIQELSESLTK
ncbi:uncharacterized protein LOC135291689 isoform X4 [Passer domesticus]|uniref:uncharacterized protein LOC135291689 isoform X4 n=1 Tax=Passer domesticus TaxID=48849 RepID=UPI0030FE1810